MDIDNLVEKGKAVLDANGDGTVEAQEVIDKVTGRVKETAEAAGAAFDEIKKGFDADADGSVSVDEVKAVAEGIAGKAKEAFASILGKAEAAADEAVEADVVEAEVVEDEAAEPEAVEEEVVVEAEAVEDAPEE